MALGKKYLIALRIFAIVCLLLVLGWFVVNMVLMHAVLEHKLDSEVPYPGGQLLLITLAILTSVVLTTFGKRLGFYVYLGFVLVFGGLILASMNGHSMSDMIQEALFSFGLLAFPLVLLHFALPTKERKN